MKVWLDIGMLSEKTASKQKSTQKNADRKRNASRTTLRSSLRRVTSACSEEAVRTDRRRLQYVYKWVQEGGGHSPISNHNCSKVSRLAPFFLNVQIWPFSSMTILTIFSAANIAFYFERQEIPMNIEVPSDDMGKNT